MEKIIEIQNLNFRYPNQREYIFENLNLDVGKGDFIALVGANGTGKSTLIKLMLGELKGNSGNVKINIKSDNPYKEIGYVPQLAFGSSYNFPITVKELISLSLYSELKGFKRMTKKIEEEIMMALKMVGMIEYADRLYSQLSGGQKQRVLIAKALVSNPSLLILDEPTNGIDSGTRKSLYKLLHHLNDFHHITILMITHELQDIKNYITKLYLLEDGKIEVKNSGDF